MRAARAVVVRQPSSAEHGRPEPPLLAGRDAF